MELTEDEMIKKNGTLCKHCAQNMLLPYEYDWSSFGCGCNVIKRKYELCKNQRKKINFINRIKYAEQKIFCICKKVYQLYEGDDYDKIYEVLSTLKNKKLKINRISINKYKEMIKNPDFD